MTQLRSLAPPTVLYVDDSADDQALALLAVNRCRACFQMQCFPDVTSAQNYLLGKGAFANRTAYPFPALVLVDYAIAAECGRDLIIWIRNQPQFEGLTCIVCSDNEADGRFDECYGVGANYCLRKPMNIERLQAFIECLSRSLAAKPPHYNELVMLAEYRAPISQPGRLPHSDLPRLRRD